MDKKKRQLGMNPSTASNRLVKDVLWMLIIDTNQDLCYRCKKPMTRDTFSIEHIKPWLDSKDPIGLYFDLGNIDFSHITCNSGARRRDKLSCGSCAAYARGCRCNDCRAASAEKARDQYNPEYRKTRYLKNEKK